MKNILLGLLLFTLCSQILAQNLISVPFPNGFIGTQGTNAQMAENIENFSTLGIEIVYFSQNSSGNIFEVQGNDIVGTITLVSSNTGQTLDIDGALVWRITSGSTLEVLGFIPNILTPVINLSSIGLPSYQIDSNSNFGLKLVSSTFPIVDGTNVSGNAATSGLLDSLNSYLSEIQLNAPSGPVTVIDLTTTDTTPTLSGTVHLSGGETFSIIINGQTYDTTNGISIVGTDWTLTLPQINNGTYSVSAVISNPSFYNLTSTGTLIVQGCQSAEVSINASATEVCAGESVDLTVSSGLTAGTIACTSADLPANLQTGLVGYWPFCGNANDESGNGHNGTVNGATLTADRFGNADSAYSFDGVDDWIVSSIEQSSTYSVSVWVNINYNTSHNAFVQHKDNCTRGGGYLLETNSTGILRHLTYDCGSCSIPACTNELDFNAVSYGQIQTGEWNLFTVTSDGSGNYKYYINNQLIENIYAPNINIDYGVKPFSIGKHHDGNNLFYSNGTLDDIGLWNRALTETEIQQLANSSTYTWSTGDTTENITVTPTETTEYWVDVTTNGVTCREYVTITVTAPAAPTGDLEQTFCSSSTVADLTATGENIQWYDAATGGNLLDSTTALTDGQMVYASQTVNGCESTDRLEVTVSIQDITITASATEVCAGESVDFSINVIGSNFSNWNTNEPNNSGGNENFGMLVLVDNVKYNDHRDSNSNPDFLMESDSDLGFLSGFNFLGEFEGHFYYQSTSNYTWTNADATATSLGAYLLIINSQAEIDFIDQTSNITGHGSWIGMYQDTNHPDYSEPSGAWFWGDGTAVTMSSNPPTYTWSTGDTSANISVTPTETTEYWVDVTTNGVTCREYITINVTAPAAPTGPLTQSFCDTATITDLTATGENIQWYDAATGGNLLDSTTALADGQMVYATQTVNGCESTDRLAVTVSIQDITITASATEVCAGESIDLTVSSGLTAGTTACTSADLPANLQTGLVGYWPFCGNANDESGNGNNGTVNGATLTTDRFGNADSAYSFDGINHIDLGNSNVLNPSSEISFHCAFFIPNSFNSNFILGRNSDLSSNYGYNFGVLGNDSTQFLRMGIANNTSGSNLTDISAQVSLEKNRWYSFSGTFDGFEVRLYLDGLLVHIEPVVLPNGLHLNSYNTFIGKYRPSGGANAEQYFKGSLDNLGIWNRALLLSEVQLLHNLIEYTWSTGDTTETISVTPTETTEYWVDVTTNGVTCREYITIDVTAPAAPTGPLTHAFCDAATVADLTVTGDNIQWYEAATGGNLLDSTTALTDGQMVYASQTVNGCESTDRLEVTVSVQDITITASATEVCAGESVDLSVDLNLPTICDMQINLTDIPLGQEIPGFTYGGFYNEHYYYVYNDPTSWTDGEQICRENGGYLVCINDESENTFVSNLTNNNIWIGLFRDPETCEFRWLDCIDINYTNWRPGEPNSGPCGEPYTQIIRGCSFGYNTWNNLGNNSSNGACYSNMVPIMEIDPEIYQTFDPSTTYLWSTGNTTETISVTPTETTEYWVDVTTNGVTCREYVTITVNDLPEAPTGESVNYFINCDSFSPNLNDAIATLTGDNIKLYDAAVGGNLLDPNSNIIDNQVVYASQTLDSCESSDRLEVQLNLYTLDTPTTAVPNNTVSFCNEQNLTILDLAPAQTATDRLWYETATSTTPISETTPLVDGVTYYVSNYNLETGCESDRLAMTVEINNPEAPTGDAVQSFCDNVTVSDLSALGSNIQWYDAAVGGNVLDPSSALSDGQFLYASQTENSCESITRLEVSVEIDIIPDPILITTELEFCLAREATLADLEVDEQGFALEWYDSFSEGNMLPMDTLLEDGVSYYATLYDAASGCESLMRLEVVPTVIPCEVVIYNAISLNDNGMNDYMVIENAEYFPDNSLEIYNRDGHLLYSQTQYGIGDNLFRGIANVSGIYGSTLLGDGPRLPTGSYLYVFKYFNPYEQQQYTLKGFLTINSN